MTDVESVRMCLAEAGFVEGRDYGGLYEGDEPETVSIWGHFYIHDAEAVTAALVRATALVRQAKYGNNL